VHRAVIKSNTLDKMQKRYMTNTNKHNKAEPGKTNDNVNVGYKCK